MILVAQWPSVTSQETSWPLAINLTKFQNQFLHFFTAKPQRQSYIHPQQLHGCLSWLLCFCPPISRESCQNTQPFWILFVERNSNPKSKRKTYIHIYIYIHTIDGRNPKQAPGMMLEPCLFKVDFNYLSLNWFSPGVPNTLSASLAVSPRSKPKRKRSIPNLGKRWSWCDSRPQLRSFKSRFFFPFLLSRG